MGDGQESGRPRNPLACAARNLLLHGLADEGLDADGRRELETAIDVVDARRDLGFAGQLRRLTRDFAHSINLVGRAPA